MPYSRKISYIVAILFSALLGTYLDLYFVGKGYYEFPNRLFPDIFSIQIIFPLIILPILVGFILFILEKMKRVMRYSFLLFLSGIISVVERISEILGLFQHGQEWKHSNSFLGYFLFFVIVWKLYQWINARL